jgi:CRP-like cAMP-binding protein
VRSKRELTELLGAVDLFSRCSRSELKTVARHVETVRLDPGVELTRQGDAGDAFYVILDGRAQVTVDGELADTLGPGQYFGELALLDGEPRSATVASETELEVAVLGLRMFRTLLREFPDLCVQLLAGLAGALRQARGQAG